MGWSGVFYSEAPILLPRFSRPYWSKLRWTLSMHNSDSCRPSCLLWHESELNYCILPHSSWGLKQIWPMKYNHEMLPETNEIIFYLVDNYQTLSASQHIMSRDLPPPVPPPGAAGMSTRDHDAHTLTSQKFASSWANARVDHMARDTSRLAGVNVRLSNCTEKVNLSPDSSKWLS